MALAEKIITRTARILEQSATTTIVMDGYRYDIGKDFLLIRGKGLKQPTLIRAGERYEVLFQPVTSGREMEKNGDNKERIPEPLMRTDATITGFRVELLKNKDDILRTVKIDVEESDPGIGSGYKRRQNMYSPRTFIGNDMYNVVRRMGR
jgi:hypothetical protein